MALSYKSHSDSEAEKGLDDSTKESEIMNDTNRYDPDFWPYSGVDLDRLLKKWARKISVDLASHIPPKMACMIGSFWNTFGTDTTYREAAFKMLNDLLLLIWLKNMVPIVNVNAGSVYQMTIQDRQYISNFLSILHEKLSDTDLEIKNTEKMSPIFTTQPRSKHTYHTYMEACYESLGHYVSNLKPRETHDYLVQVSYYFQCITASTLLPLLQYFAQLDETKPRIPSDDFEIVFKKKKELETIVSRLDQALNEECSKAGVTRGSTYIVFSKKRVVASLERVHKNFIANSSKFFEAKALAAESEEGNEGMILTHPLEVQYSKRKDLLVKMDSMDHKLVDLLRDYLRSIDLNYIDASRSYYKQKFTLKDLLKRDKVNKKFTKINMIKMGNDTGPTYSAQLAADYIIHKMEEMKEDLILTGNNSAETLKKAPSINPEQRDSLEPTTFTISDELGMRSSEPLSIEKGRRPLILFKEGDNLFKLDLPVGSPSQSTGKLIDYIHLISCENTISTKYYHGLATALARSKALFENRYISSFEVTMKFGLESLEKMTAYLFVEKHLAEHKNLGIRIEESEESIEVLAPDETSDLTKSMIQPKEKNSLALRLETIIKRETVSPVMPLYKVIEINSFDEAFAYLKTSKEIKDFTTLGSDKRFFKAALHKLLKLFKKAMLMEFEKSGLASCMCVEDKFKTLVEQGVFNIVSSKIFLDVMSKQPTMKDFCFFMRCRCLEFLKLNDLIQKPDKDGKIEYMSKYLDGVIDKLKSIDEGGSVFLVIQCIEQSLMLISDLFHIVLGSKQPAGSEDILPIFLYCLIKANLQRAQSIYYFIDLMMIKEERRGKDGFNFTQIETGINFVELMEGRSIGLEDNLFNTNIMSNEVERGIHTYRRRNLAAREKQEFTVQSGFSLI